MIGHFPLPYPDELFYSICARFRDRMRYLVKTAAVEELFGAPRIIVAVDFPTNLDNLIATLPPGTCYTFEYIVNNHSLLPFYAPFLPSAQLQNLLQDMHQNKGGGMYIRAGVTNCGTPLPQWLRFCPQCVEKDRASIGECYWHRIHQVPGVEVCPHHAARLQDSTVLVRNNKKGYDLLTTENTIPNTLAHIPESSETHSEIFQQIALDAFWLLNQPNIASRLEFLQDQYKRILATQGMATYLGKVRTHKLLPAFESTYPLDLLKQLHCESEGYGKKNWITRFFRKPYITRRPIQHILWMHFLGHTAETFLNLPVEHSSFGDGPWPCLNPVCKYYHQPHIQEYSVKHNHKWGSYGAPVATFSCDCGFMYSRMGPDLTVADQFRSSVVECYGDEWEQALHQMWEDESASLQDISRHLGVDSSSVKCHAARLGLSFFIANRIGKFKPYAPEWEQTLCRLWQNEAKGLKEIARQLGVNPSTVKHHATRLGLSFHGSQGRSTFSESEKQSVHEQRLQKQEMHRTLWMSAIKENPEIGLKKLRARFPQTYSWLSRNDAEWLKQSTTEKRNSLKERTNTLMSQISKTSKDFQLAEAVKKAAHHLKETQERPVRISATAIRIHLDLGKPGSFQFSLKKLPITALALKEVVETYEMFAVRRIWWTVDLFLQENHYPSRRKFARKAGISRSETIQIKEAIDSALQTLRLSLNQ